MEQHDVLICSLIWRKCLHTVYAMLDAALRTFYGFCLRLCTSFVYVYSFCVRLCTAFAHVLRIFCTYTDFVRVEHLCVRIWLIFCDVWCRLYRGIQSSKFFDLFCQCGRLWFVDSLEDPILNVLSISLSARAAHYYWTVSRILKTVHESQASALTK